eukprot:TRINITY_DN41790_c0_g1_i1.p1 TRINITY_DN41790_c0_g1~~TRINITY_DN41790_c0_g1_i1.p1  ORF type:complete len:179 (+),score=37.49 TRINITY_DN41790_c0_g1_i1:62-538(+)
MARFADLATCSAPLHSRLLLALLGLATGTQSAGVAGQAAAGRLERPPSVLVKEHVLLQASLEKGRHELQGMQSQGDGGNKCFLKSAERFAAAKGGFGELEAGGCAHTSRFCPSSFQRAADCADEAALDDARAVRGSSRIQQGKRVERLVLDLQEDDGD